MTFEAFFGRHCSLVTNPVKLKPDLSSFRQVIYFTSPTATDLDSD